MLNDIKECLMKLFCLYNKSTKKLRSLKKLIDELDDLLDLDNWQVNRGRWWGIIIIINTLFEIGKNLHSSAKNLQSNLYQLKK